MMKIILNGQEFELPIERMFPMMPQPVQKSQVRPRNMLNQNYRDCVFDEITKINERLNRVEDILIKKQFKEEKAKVKPIKKVLKKTKSKKK